MICNQCKTAVPDGSAFCPVCGMAFQGQKCNDCGAIMTNGSRFCPRCGKDQSGWNNCKFCNSPMVQGAKVCQTCGRETVQQTDSIEGSYAARTLTFGILGLAFALTGWLSVLGIIFSAIARSNLEKYLGCTGGIVKDGRAKAGNGLSKAGIIVGIILSVITVLYLIAIVVIFPHINILRVFENIW